MVNNPRWRSVMRRQLPRPGAWVGSMKPRGREDEPRLAAGVLDRQARQSAESYLHACPYSRVTPAPCAPSAESQALSVSPPHPHLTSPRPLALPHSPRRPPWRTSRVCAHLKKLRASSRSPFCLIDVPYAAVSSCAPRVNSCAVPHI